MLCGLLLVAPVSAGELLWYVESPTGAVRAAQGADRPVNPASVVKVATSAWALDRLGAGHRFETRFLVTGPIEDGTVDGDLIVHGGDDPDFHSENAWLVAAALRDAGVRRVGGRLQVDGRFRIGWEGGSARRERDPEARRRQMADRLVEALRGAGSPDVSDREAFLARHGLSAWPPMLETAGRPGSAPGSAAGCLLVTHRSNPLSDVLERFNAWSNNDIERLEASLGSPRELAAWVAAELAADGVRFASLSGLGTNRLALRHVAGLVGLLEERAAREGLAPGDLLPVVGCDPGTLKHYPRLGAAHRGTLVAKTGTLTTTDGGVAVLAGTGPHGRFALAVVGAGSGAGQREARRRIEDKLLELLPPGTPGECPPPPVFSDAGARLLPPA